MQPESLSDVNNNDSKRSVAEIEASRKALKEREEHLLELVRRSRESRMGAGKNQPYHVLGLEEGDAATQASIRKAYRKLSLKFHPDKNENLPDAVAAFADIVDAYEVLGDVQKRAEFDDSTDQKKTAASRRGHGQSESDADEDFYAKNPHILNLNQKLWFRQPEESIWLIEVYAPWCPPCRKLKPMIETVANSLALDADKEEEHRAHDDVEDIAAAARLGVSVGAINFEAGNNKDWANEHLGVTGLPTLLLLNRKHRMRAKYDMSTSNARTAESVLEWVRRLSAEWRYLFRESNVTLLDGSTFGPAVLNSTQMWVVLFSDGLGPECTPCTETLNNMRKLSAALRAYPVSVGVVNCQDSASSKMCYDSSAKQRTSAQPQFAVRLEVPAPPHAPQVRAWRRGNKTDHWEWGGGDKGEVMYNANEVPPHIGLQIMEKSARLALAEEKAPPSHDLMPTDGEEARAATDAASFEAPSTTDTGGGGGGGGGNPRQQQTSENVFWDGPRKNRKELPGRKPRKFVYGRPSGGQRRIGN